MNELQFILLYAIIHLSSVVYMFHMFDYEGYIADELDRCIIWLFAPEIVVITLIKAIGGNK